jgi:hypothetical protein
MEMMEMMEQTTLPSLEDGELDSSCPASVIWNVMLMTVRIAVRNTAT